MNQAIGLVEVKGLASAIQIADTMVKVAAVDLLGVQKAKGFAWMTVEVAGDVGAVKAAVDAAKASAIAEGSFVSALVIPRPANSLDEVMLQNVDFPKKKEVTQASSIVEEKPVEQQENPLIEMEAEPAVEAEKVIETDTPLEKAVKAVTEAESSAEKESVNSKENLEKQTQPAQEKDNKKSNKSTAKKAVKKQASKNPKGNKKKS